MLHGELWQRILDSFARLLMQERICYLVPRIFKLSPGMGMRRFFLACYTRCGFVSTQSSQI
jgi:hypothetical protein